jgi:hypothetical protein
MRHQRLPHGLKVPTASQRLATHGDDLAVARYLPVTMAVIQRGQQLAHGQVAGATEYDQVEFLDR